MSEKHDNNLFKVTNEERHYVHWFTSIGRIAADLEMNRSTVEYAFLKNKTTNGYKIELVDGTDIKYKDIN